MASINIQNNEYDYNKFYSHSQRDGSFIEHDEANKKSANESLGFGNGSIANIKERLFTQDDLFLEGEVQYPVSIVHFHGQSSESGMSLGVIHNAIGKLPSRGNSRVSPKTGIEVVRGLGSIVQHANHNDFVFSPSPRGNLQSNTSGLQPKDIKISGSLNIKDLGSASYSDGNELGTYSTERYDPHLAGRLHTNFKQPEPFQSKLGLNKIQKGENGLAFDGLTIGVAAKHRNPRRLVTPDRLEEHRREQVQNHFFKTSPSSSDKTDFLRDNIPLSGLEEAEDRLMASDGLQEVEHKISFQRDPDSNPNTAHKSDGRGSANSLSSSQKKSHLQRDTLPRVNTGAIDSEVLQRLEQKYMKGHRANRDSNDALQTYRKDSVGSKLRDALVNLKTKGSIAQPFKKKAQMIHLKASRGSSRNSQNSSALGKKQSLKAMDVGPQKNLVMVALNSMILKGRKESFGQHTSRQNSIKSQKLSGSSSKVASSRAGTEKDSNRLDHILNNAETVDKGSRSASHKAVRRRNVLDLNSKTREQSLAKSETGKPSSTTQKSALKIASSKISSNSTKRLFEKIFSKDKRQEGHSSDMRKHRTQVEHDVREKASEGSLRHAERSGKYSRAESKKNLELDSLIKKMYQASSGRDDLQEANRGQGMVLTDSDHRSVPSLFASKRSLFLNTLAHRQMVDESDADRRSRGKLASSRQEMSAGLDLNAIDSSKVSLMTSKTNPEKGFGFLNPEQILAKKHGKLSQSKLLQPRGHEQWVDDSRQHSARETDQRLLPVVEQEELIIHRKTIFQAGPPRAGTARSGHIREGKELSNLPRCPTESGYSTQAIIDKYSHLLKPDTANKQRSAIYPQQRLGKPASQKKTLKSAKDQKDTASISKRQEDSHQSTRADRLNKPSLLSDFIHSFDTRHKEFD